MKYVVVVERTPGTDDWGAYVPDLPGCVAVGDSREEVETLIRSAIQMHLRGMLRDGDPIPPPGSWTTEIEVSLDEAMARRVV
jgi:predicted RNase H-like HicB family nuclease